MHGGLVGEVDGLVWWVAPRLVADADDFVDYQICSRVVLQLVCFQVDPHQTEDLGICGKCVGSLFRTPCGFGASLTLCMRQLECILRLFVSNVITRFRWTFALDVAFDCVDSEVDTFEVCREDLGIMVLEIDGFCWIGEPLRRTSCTEEFRAMRQNIGVDCEPLLLVERLFAYYNVEGAREVVPANRVSRCFRTDAEELPGRA